MSDDPMTVEEAERMLEVIASLNVPPRSDKPMPVVEWWCNACKHWFLWPHSYPTPRRLMRQFKWRIDEHDYGS